MFSVSVSYVWQLIILTANILMTVVLNRLSPESRTVLAEEANYWTVWYYYWWSV